MVFIPNLTLLKDEGGYSVVVNNLPGVRSCGPTKEAAIAGVREAIDAAFLAFKEDINDTFYVQMPNTITVEP